MGFLPSPSLYHAFLILAMLPKTEYKYRLILFVIFSLCVTSGRPSRTVLANFEYLFLRSITERKTCPLQVTYCSQSVLRYKKDFFFFFLEERMQCRIFRLSFNLHFFFKFKPTGLAIGSFFVLCGVRLCDHGIRNLNLFPAELPTLSILTLRKYFDFSWSCLMWSSTLAG